MSTSPSLPNELPKWPQFESQPNTWLSNGGEASPDQVMSQQSTLPYIFGGGIGSDIPDTTFTQTPFDSSLSTSLSQFDIDHLDIWPSGWYDSGFTNSGVPDIYQDGYMFEQPELKGSPVESSVAPPKYGNQTANHSRKAKTSRIPSNVQKHSTTPLTKIQSTTEMNRTNHNQIEHRYRTSLNAKYGHLRTCLPESIISKDEGEGSKRVGRAGVLVGALQHVKELEEKGKRLEEEKELLEGRIGTWEGLWVETRGKGI